MKTTVLLILFIVSLSCSEDNRGSSENDNFDATLNVRLQNSEGGDIFDSVNFPTDNISYCYKDGDGEAMPPDGSVPIFFNEDGSTKMRIFLNSDELVEFPVTYVKWNETDTDTIKAHFQRGEENGILYEYCDEVWINDVSVWQIASQGTGMREVTIIK